ncbi:MAG: hypothetical protein M1814_002420 [Vezdaea aestivalis]|nr:MAG: hypothetical protein M1814_002420 [Vezdaea aestivalis]
MADTSQQLLDFDLLCFDCYGTIIDWETGIHDRLCSLLPSSLQPDLSRSQLLNIYAKHEHATQIAHPTIAYSKILRKVYHLVVEELGCPVPTETEAEVFGASVGSWPVFPDSVSALQSLGKHFKLVPLSNVDSKSLEETVMGPLEGLVFDARYTAEEIRTYKPDLNNFHYMIKQAKKDFGVDKNQILVVAQSLMHDHVPARKVGLKSCWIERGGATSGIGGLLTDLGDQVDFNWRFKTLGDLAALVEKEAAKSK